MLIYLPTGRRELNVKAVVAAFNQEKALVGAFSVITNLWMELFEALIPSALQTSGFFIEKAPRCPPCVPSNCITVTLGTGAGVTCWRMVTTTGVMNTRGGSQQGDIRERHISSWRR